MPATMSATRGDSAGAEQTQVVYIPLKLPLDSARHAPGTMRGYRYFPQNADWTMSYK
jgi:hypothetical protein